jgi:hypothetical protein
MDEGSGKSIKSLRALAVADVRSIAMLRRRCRAKVQNRPISCWSANNPATRRTWRASRSSDRLADSALNDAGIAREDTFVTNAVKHILNTKCAASGGCTSAIIVDGLTRSCSRSSQILQRSISRHRRAQPYRQNCDHRQDAPLLRWSSPTAPNLS